MAEAMTLADITWPKQQFRSADGTKDRLEFSVWGGAIRLGLCKENEFKPFFSKVINPRTLVLIKGEITKIMKAGPGTKLPLVFSTWDPETKKSKPDWVFVLIKDDKLVYNIEIHTGGNVYKFALKGPFGVSRGSDPMNDGDKSEVDMQVLLDFLTMQGPIGSMFSNKKREFNSNGGRSQGGGNSGGGGASSGGGDDSYF